MPIRMVSSIAGLGDRDLGRIVSFAASGMRREVWDPFVDEERGEIMDSEEVLEALDTLRTLLLGSLGPAGEGVRRYLELALDGPATAPEVVSIASREYMDSKGIDEETQPQGIWISRCAVCSRSCVRASGEWI